MSTTANPDQLSTGSKPGSGTKTLCIKNVPHAVWQKARQNALASNLSFGEYVLAVLASSGPLLPAMATMPQDGHARGDQIEAKSPV